MPIKALRVAGIQSVLYTPPKYQDAPLQRPAIFDETTGSEWKPDINLSGEGTLTMNIEEFLRTRAREKAEKAANETGGTDSKQQSKTTNRSGFPFIFYVTRSEEIADAMPRHFRRPTEDTIVNRGLLHLIADGSVYYMMHPEVRRAAYMLATNFVVFTAAYEDIVARDAEELAKHQAASPGRRKPLRGAINIMLDALLAYLKKEGGKIDEDRIILCSGPTGRSNWQPIWMAAIQNPTRFAGLVPITGGGATYADDDEDDRRGFIYWDRTVQLTAPEFINLHVTVVALGDEDQATPNNTDNAEGLFPSISISALALRHAISFQMISALKASGNKHVVERRIQTARTQRERYEEKGNPFASVEMAKLLLEKRRQKKTVIKL